MSGKDSSDLEPELESEKSLTSLPSSENETRHLRPIDFEYRSTHEPDHKTIITNCRVYISLPPSKSAFAQFRYVYDIKYLGEEPMGIWWHDIPSSAKKIAKFTAKDASKTLKLRSEEQNESKTVVGIEFGDLLVKESEYHFEFSYEAATNGFEFKAPFSRIIVYKDLFIYDCACNYLSVHLNFPPQARIVGSYPEAAQPDGFLSYEAHTLSPLDDFSILIAYRIEGWPGLNWTSVSVFIGILGIIATIAGIVVTVLSFFQTPK